MEAISRGSHQAFAELFDRTARTLAADLTARVAQPRQRTAILAATYVEVWWLAGCRSDADADVVQWICRILERRIADSYRGPRDEGDQEPGHSRAGSSSREAVPVSQPYGGGALSALTAIRDVRSPPHLSPPVHQDVFPSRKP
jgi:DNA-directed RNA polymerase specialized sigma24 family protein